MNDKNTGGAAFPRPAGDYNGTKRGNGAQDGMSLRDYFAAKAMQGMIAADVDFDISKVEKAKYAYEMADAMLKERQK